MQILLEPPTTPSILLKDLTQNHVIYAILVYPNTTDTLKLYCDESLKFIWIGLQDSVKLPIASNYITHTSIKEAITELKNEKKRHPA